MAHDFTNLSVFVVDDDLTMNLIFTNIFKMLKVKSCYSAKSGEEAVSLFKQHNPDIVVTDFLMPGINGVELTKAIRKRDKENNKITPIILMSGNIDSGMIKNALDSGVTEFLLKPFSVHDLTKRVVYMLTKPRKLIDSADYYGPDRRRDRKQPYSGQEKRKS